MIQGFPDYFRSGLIFLHPDSLITTINHGIMNNYSTHVGGKVFMFDTGLVTLRFAILSLFLALFSMEGKAQLPPSEFTIQSGIMTPDEYVRNILVGQGVEVSNVVFTGNLQAIGNFFGESDIGIDAGLILSSGKALEAKGSGSQQASTSFNLTGDDDLRTVARKCGDGITTNPSRDAAILEFDFVPQSTFVEFRYVFGSEEYPEYVGAAFNDAFGFFISGPGIDGFNQYSNNARNIALVPSTFGELVCINSVNHLSNSQYYVNNSGGTYIKYDGFTHVFTARSPVVPCSTYHIKLSISDIQDWAYDSGVFLEANSFSSVGVASALSFTHAAVDTAVENCNSASLEFRLSTRAFVDFTLHYEIAGTAENGVDYEWIADSIVIPSGDSTATIHIIPITDDIPESTKVVEIIFNTSLCEVMLDTARIWIKDYPEFFLNQSAAQSIECGQTAFIRAGANGGIEPWEYFWDSGNPADTTDIIQVTPLVSTTYTVQVTDVCGNLIEESIFVEVRGPIAEISAGSEVNICLNDNIDLTVDGGTSWLWSTGETTQTINVAPIVNTTYTVSVSDDCGNTDDAGILVTVGQPFADAGVYDGICVGQSIELIANDTPNGSWVWTDMVTGEVQNGRIVTFTPLISSQFCVDVTDNCGNTVSDCTFIDVFQLSADAGTDQEICAGNEAILTGISSTGSGTYTWTDGTNTYTGQVVSVYPVASTQYTLTVTDGCEATAVVNVTVNPLPVVTAISSASAICPDESVTISAGGALNYIWTSLPVDPTMSNPLLGDITATPVGTTLYTVTGTDINNCSNTQVVGVTVKERMFADFAASQPAVCEGDDLTLTYTGNGQSYATYTWDFDGGSASGSGQGPIAVSWANAGTKNITLTVTQLNCASEQVQVSVDVNAMPQADFTAGIASGCIPLEVTFTDASQNSVPGTTYDWDFGIAGSRSGNSVAPSFTQSGAYDVQLIVTNPGGCVDQKSASGFVNAWPLPVAGFNANPETASMKNPVLGFQSTSTGDSLTYLWNMGDGTIYTDPQFTHTYADSGFYQTVLLVENEFGCTDIFEKTIFISPKYMLRIPNAFTPNGDGLNDEFTIAGNGVKEFSIYIYNRWGALVYFSNNIEASWDGKVSGNPALAGSYIYKVFFKDENDEVAEYTGSFFLMR